MFPLLLAQAFAGMSILHVIVVIIIVAAAIGILYVALRHFGVAIPPVVITIAWIVFVAVIAILAIKLLWSML